MITGEHKSLEKLVNRKICIELLKEMFDSLSEKDKAILGHVFGVFGYEKKTLDEIAFEEMMKIDGVEKAKNAALKRLKKKYPNSKLHDWKDIYKAVMYGN
jgi:DNA-directed RNA polymerase sigma subunit (sigma70/sigma32)